MEIKDKVIIVTGASKGIRLSIAKILAKKGAKVVLAARSADLIGSLERDYYSGLSLAGSGCTIETIPSTKLCGSSVDRLALDAM